MGEDLDLCWRAQVVGARVLVAPEARVRHLEELASGADSLDPAMLVATADAADTTGGAEGAPTVGADVAAEPGTDVEVTGPALVTGSSTGTTGASVEVVAEGP